MSNDTLKYLEVLQIGNLTEQAEETGAAFAIGFIDLLWTAWIVVSMLVSWPNSEHTGVWDPPITYLWGLKFEFAMFNSWLPIGYLSSWAFNFFVFFIELIAWWASGEFFLVWVHVGLWGGFILGLFPALCEVLYIFQEYPGRQSGSAWPFVFWSAEFWMLFMQGTLWLLSFIIHLIAVGPVIRMVRARQALDLGLTLGCQCESCPVPEDEFQRAQAEKACSQACDVKCPKPKPACPLQKFEDESDIDYDRRCSAAAQLAQAAARREAAQDAEEYDDEALEIDPGTDDNSVLDEPYDDVSSPEDEW